MESLVNKVAQSGIITFSLEELLPAAGAIASFDLKPFLFREMILKEKDFRQAISEWDWAVFEGKHVAVCCSADAIIPMWAYMLVTSKLSPLAASVRFGTAEAVREAVLLEHIAAINAESFRDQRVVIKGCGDKPLPDSAFVAITARLLPVVKSLMYGEPCSTVPVYKKKV